MINWVWFMNKYVTGAISGGIEGIVKKTIDTYIHHADWLEVPNEPAYDFVAHQMAWGLVHRLFWHLDYDEGDYILLKMIGGALNPTSHMLNGFVDGAMFASIDSVVKGYFHEQSEIDVDHPHFELVLHHHKLEHSDA